MKISRRQFISKTTALTMAGAFPMLAIGANKRIFGSNERVNVALVGIGGKGVNTLVNLKGNCNLVAFADCDDNPDRSGITRKEYPDIPLYRDFRVMLDKHHRDIDAVVIATPDHTHHYIAMTCMARGKHVYVEKPLAHNISEVRDLMKAEKETGLICQMGNQGHSGQGIELLRAWVEAGVLGDIVEVKAWINRCRLGKGNKLKRLPGQPIPDTISWDLWLGPAAYVPYNKGYCPASWRYWNEFGNGPLGDFGCHNMDAPFDVFNLDCPSKVKLESTGKSEFSFPESSKLTFTFDSPKYGKFPLTWYEGKTFKPERPKELNPELQMGSLFGGTLIVGTKTTVLMGSHAGIPRIIPLSLHKELAPTLPRLGKTKRSHHHLNWLRSIKGEEKCRSPFSYGGRLTEALMYGLISMRVYRDLTIDPIKKTILGDEEALKLMSYPQPRKGWEVG